LEGSSDTTQSETQGLTLSKGDWDMIQSVCDGTIQSEADCDTVDKDVVATQFEGDDFDIKIMTGKGVQLEDDCGIGHLVNVDTVALFSGGCDLALFIMTLSVDD